VSIPGALDMLTGCVELKHCTGTVRELPGSSDLPWFKWTWQPCVRRCIA